MAPIRVGLFIDTDNFGGAESVVISLVKHLAEGPHEPIVYQFNNAYLENACSELDVPFRTVTHWNAYKRTYRLPWFAWHFRRMLAADRIDVLHSHLFGPIIAGGLGCWPAGPGHVGTLHDVYIVQERPARAYLLRLVHSLGTRLVCVSEQMASYYASVTGIGERHLEVIRNGVDLTVYGNRTDRGQSGAAARLVMVGRLDRIKRHDLLLRALSELGDDPRWHASILGEGPERDSLESLAAELRLGERVSFLGQRGDVAEQLASSDIFLLTSDSEGMSLSLIEAIVSGLPVIATRVGNNAELVRDGWNGYLIEPGNVAQLKRALETLLADAELRSKLGANSRRLGSDLDLKLTLERYVSLYEHLASK